MWQEKQTIQKQNFFLLSAWGFHQNAWWIWSGHTFSDCDEIYAIQRNSKPWFDYNPATWRSLHGPVMYEYVCGLTWYCCSSTPSWWCGLARRSVQSCPVWALPRRGRWPPTTTREMIVNFPTEAVRSAVNELDAAGTAMWLGLADGLQQWMWRLTLLELLSWIQAGILPPLLMLLWWTWMMEKIEPTGATATAIVMSWVFPFFCVLCVCVCLYSGSVTGTKKSRWW